MQPDGARAAADAERYVSQEFSTRGYLMSDWNPNLYMQFRSERTQPSIDLISKINSVEPKSVIDLGCGPGNSTQVLVALDSASLFSLSA